MKYNEWMTDENLVRIRGWAMDGLTDKQISHNMGITRKTLGEWKNRFSALSAALKKGKEVVDYAVESALLKSAMEGNVTAMIFWLKNRRPDKWRDKHDYSHNIDSRDNDNLFEAIKTAIDDNV